MKRLTIFLLAAAIGCVLQCGAAPRALGQRTSRPLQVVAPQPTSYKPAKLGPAANLSYPNGHILALQICLDRRGFSVNALDGTTGRKTDVALATYCAVQGIPFPARSQQAKAWEELFPGETNLFTTIYVTPEDRRAIMSIPRAPAEKAALPTMGYQSMLEMYAERGRLTEATLRALNPRVRWPNPQSPFIFSIIFI